MRDDDQRRAEQADARLQDGAADSQELSERSSDAAREELRRVLDATEARLTELSHLSARLDEVGSQAHVAALNVAIEISRDGEAKQETLTTFADEVRRFAERVEAVARRLTVVVEAVRDDHRLARGALDTPGATESSTALVVRAVQQAVADLLRRVDDRVSSPTAEAEKSRTDGDDGP